MQKTKGITLIALVVTIIILIILAGITITLLLSDNGLLGRAEEAKFKTRMSELNEKTELYIMDTITESLIESSTIMQRTKINAGYVLEDMIKSGNTPLDPSFADEQINHTLKQIMKDIKAKEEKYIVVYEGEMCYVSQDSIPNNEKQEQWCREIGIRILEFEDLEGMDKTNGDYEYVNGIYMCTPNLTEIEGLKSRYLKLDDKGDLVPTSTFTTSTPDPDWYNYKEQKWANIYIENEGYGVYYVWIPRYAYKPAEGNVAKEERADVLFIDTSNNYKYIDEKTGEEKEKTWTQLESEGYTIPDAFGWGDNDDNINQNAQIPGFWMSKYVLGEISNYVVQYDFSAEDGGVVISNIETNVDVIVNTNGESVIISGYEFSINGVVKDIYTEKPETYTFKQLRVGMNAFTVTLLDQNGEIIGSMTKDFEVSEANAPDLSGFDKKNTYYVTYDENENEHSTIPITEKEPINWYNYPTKQWANIVVRQNGAETYYTWIPRYCYTTSGERATVKFLEGTSTDIPEGYILPDAFAWGDDDSNSANNTPISGFWITKYVLGESNALDINTEITTTSGTIITQGLTGTGITTGQKYIYWIDGNKKVEKENSEEKVTYSGLETGKIYTILIEIRDISTDALIGTITKEAKITSANVPVLTGFDNSAADGNNTMTYYVTYGDDGTGEEDSSIPITESAPENWYDYTEKRWANIVVKQTNDSGEIVARTYYTWIPRYAYRVVTDKQRVDVIFLNNTDSTIPDDYILPDAFAWGDDDTTASNNTQLTGYWISKYVLGNSN